MAERTQWFHGTAARQLLLTESGAWGPGVPGSDSAKVSSPPRIRLMQKDMYAELTRRRRRAQIAARHLVDEKHWRS